MFITPGFAADGFGLADHQQHDIGFAGHFDGFGDQTLIFSGVGRGGDVFPPAAPGVAVEVFGDDFATFGVQHVDSLADFLADAFEDAQPVAGVGAVAAQVQAGSVRADDGQGF